MKNYIPNPFGVKWGRMKTSGDHPEGWDNPPPGSHLILRVYIPLIGQWTAKHYQISLRINFMELSWEDTGYPLTVILNNNKSIATCHVLLWLCWRSADSQALSSQLYAAHCLPITVLSNFPSPGQSALYWGKITIMLLWLYC